MAYNGDFNVDLSFVTNFEQGLEDWVSVRDANILPHEGRFAAALEINCDAVQEIRHQTNGVRRIIPVRDEDVDQPRLPRLNPNIMRKLDENRRFIVSIRQSLATITFGHLHHRLRRRIQTLNFEPLTDVIVLADS